MGSLHNQGLKAILLAGCASTFFVAAAPAMAQDAEDEEDSDSQIVVTGSRIQRPDYVANSPTVSVDEGFGASMRVWGQHPTAITVLHVAKLGRPDALVEIEALAALPRTS